MKDTEYEITFEYTRGIFVKGRTETIYASNHINAINQLLERYHILRIINFEEKEYRR